MSVNFGFGPRFPITCIMLFNYLNINQLWGHNLSVIMTEKCEMYPEEKFVKMVILSATIVIMENRIARSVVSRLNNHPFLLTKPHNVAVSFFSLTVIQEY